MHPAAAAVLLGLWVAPAPALIAALFGAGGCGLLLWAVGAGATGLFFRVTVCAYYHAHRLFPLL